jgi:hypothetical protein
VLAGCNALQLAAYETLQDLARESLLEQLLMHIVFECIFYGVVHKWISRKDAQPMGYDMWAHHIASAVAGIYCRVVRPPPPPRYPTSDTTRILLRRGCMLMPRPHL